MENVLGREFLELLRNVVVHHHITLKDGNLGGNRSKSKGSSVEFSDYREYIPGDDFRRIDWNALARFEKVFIKLFMEEREAPVTLFVDMSASMSHGKKREAAMKAAATFAYSALKEYDSVSTVLFHERIEASLHHLRGQATFSRILQLLEQANFQGESNLSGVVKAYEQRLKKGVTVLITDLMYDARLEEVLKLLTYRKQRIILCHVLSEEELYPNYEGNMRIIDSETEEHMDIMAGSEAINLYMKTLLHYMNTIKETCKKYATEYILLSSHEPIELFLGNVNRLG